MAPKENDLATDVPFVALLRGINVGGNNRVPMAELKAMLTALGFEQVRTLLQSGNAVFLAPEQETAEMERKLEEALTARLGLQIAFMVRDTKEFAESIANNPWRKEADAAGSMFTVSYYKKAPDPELVAKVSEENPGSERLAAIGRHVYTVYPEGMGRSKLKAKSLEVGTARNWNTVLKLEAMLAELSK